jgi:hypothetical protein
LSIHKLFINFSLSSKNSKILSIISLLSLFSSKSALPKEFFEYIKTYFTFLFLDINSSIFSSYLHHETSFIIFTQYFIQISAVSDLKVSREKNVSGKFFITLKNISSLLSSSSLEISIDHGAVLSAQTSIISTQYSISKFIFSINSSSLYNFESQEKESGVKFKIQTIFVLNIIFYVIIV